MFAIGSFWICPIPALLRISCGFFSPFCGCPYCGAGVWSERVCLVGTQNELPTAGLFAFYSGISIASPVVASKLTRTTGAKR